MAEAVLFNVAGTILKTLGSSAFTEIGLLWGFQDKMEKLKDTVQLIRSVLLDAERKCETSNEVRVWLNLLKDVIYDVDDLLDDISTETLRRQLLSHNVVTKEVKLFFSSSNRLVYGLKMAHKIKDLQARLEEAKENRKFLLDQNRVESTIVGLERDTHSSLPDVIIGREGDKKEIIDRLLASHDEKVMVLPIVGLGGLGKTTLAQMVYNDETVKENFDLRIWVCVSDVFNIKSILLKMIEYSDGGKSIENLEMEKVKTELDKRVKMKKYLIVLDDVWNEQRERWVQFYDMIKGGAMGSRIIITTRSKVVADITHTSLTHELTGLCVSDSWELFQGVAFKKGQAPNEVFKELGMEIVTKCCGLPLAIRTIGSLLYSKTKESEWQHFKDEELLKLDSRASIIDTLKLSYNYLPSNLKHCFAYCSLFPKDYVFDVHALISYWKSQGYVESKNEGTYSGLNCLKYLEQRCFLQIESEGEDGEIVKYKMHDFMHDLAMSVARDEIKMFRDEDVGETSLPKKTRHFSLHQVSDSIRQKHVAHLLNQKKVRTLIVQREGAEYMVMDREVLHTIIAKLKYLRVLLMPRCCFGALPHSFHRLKHLRHLDLSWNTFITELPNFIIQLVNLEVLSLEECECLKKLPKNMKKLINLFHLELSGCNCLTKMPKEIGQLTTLEVLSRFSLSKKRSGGGLDELQNLSKLRGKLKITNIQYVKRGVDECEAVNLKEKPHLRTLILEWGYDIEVDINIQEQLLEALQPHINLRELELGGYGGVKFPRWVSSLENLVKVEFKKCTKCKFLPPVHGLPSLQHLYIGDLQELEYMIDNSDITEGPRRSCFFPRLKTLTIWKCPKLKGWWSMMMSMTTTDQLPCLSELKIINCPNLKGRMPQLPSVNALTLIDVDVSWLEETLQSLVSLKTLFMDRLEIEALCEGFRHLTSLEKLAIARCDSLASLPMAMSSLTSLNQLRIDGCDQLKKKCWSRQGEYWHLISHIPNIEINWNQVQQDGIYVSKCGED